MAKSVLIRVWKEDKDKLEYLQKQLETEKGKSLPNHIAELTMPKIVHIVANESFRFYPSKFNSKVNSLFVLRRKKK